MRKSPALLLLSFQSSHLFIGTPLPLLFREDRNVKILLKRYVDERWPPLYRLQEDAAIVTLVLHSPWAI